MSGGARARPGRWTQEIGGGKNPRKRRGKKRKGVKTVTKAYVSKVKASKQNKFFF
jgi:hypothetical protein